MDLREIGLWGCGLDSTGSGQGSVAGCGECGDEPSGSCATELVSYVIISSFMSYFVALFNKSVFSKYYFIFSSFMMGTLPIMLISTSLLN
jgi:hypothetical protein